MEIPGYEVLEMLHASARSWVWRSRRSRDGLSVIVKVLASQHIDAQEAAQFQREYEVGEILQGDGAAAVLAYEPVRDRWAIVMEDFGGRALPAPPPGGLPVEQVLRRGTRIAAALAAVHKRRILHMDVTPSNIVENPETGEIKLIDFGLATVLPRGSTGIRRSKALEGTLRYMAPEQTGRMNRAIDERSDLYALGAVLYEALVGRVPFETDDPLTLVHMHLAEPPIPPADLRADLPAPVCEVVMRLLAKDPEDRYQSAEGLAADLKECLAAVSEGGLAASRTWVGGRHDIPRRFQIPQKLYGRATEIERLHAAFEHAAQGRAQMLLVRGDAGVGKTTLVAEIHKPLVARRGYYISGKFDQLRRDVPYASVVQAFGELVRQILTEPGKRLEGWTARLLEALGPSAPVVAAAVPTLSRIIGPQPPVPPLPPTEAQYRYNLAFHRFVHAVATDEHPLVLFLDDLQWADLPSLQLLEHLLSDPNIQHLLVIGAYRDREVSAAHPLMLSIDALTTDDASIVQLALPPLGFVDVLELTADALRTTPARAEPLARIVFERTGGNPFFLVQLLTRLHEDGLVQLDAEARTYRWDLDAIRVRGITDDVVAFMADKIRTLPVHAQEALERAACVGNVFDLSTLAIVEQRSPEDAAAALRAAVDEGLLIALDGGGLRADVHADMRFRFVHDRVQQAAYSLVPEEDRSSIHLNIGRLLLGSISSEALDERLFEVVNQLNMGRALVEGVSERRDFAELNLRAGRKANASAAHEPALHYLTAGVSLLPPSAWEDDYALCFALHVEAMEAEYLNAHVERGDALSELLLTRAVSVLDKVKVYETRIVYSTLRSELLTAVENGYRAMSLLGVDLPREVDLPGFLELLRETKLVIGDRSAADLLTLPATTSPERLAAVRIASLMASPSYFVDAQLSLALSLRVLALSLPYGNAPESPFLYAFYALIHAARLSDFDTSEEYGRLARTLVDRDVPGRVRARVYNLLSIFVLHYKSHVRETLPMLVDVVKTAMESGDLEYMGYGAINHSMHQFLVGERLETCLRDNERFLELANRYRLGIVANWIRTVSQAALNLHAGSADPRRLVGELFDEDEAVPDLVASNNNRGLSLLYISKTILGVLFRDDENATEAAQTAERFIQAQTGQFAVVSFHFYRALALAARVRRCEPAQRSRYLDQIDGDLDKLRKWAAAGPMNSLHRLRLVEAELARVRGDQLEAMRLYAEAIDGAAQHGWTHEEALAQELEAEHYFACGLPKQGSASLMDARHTYQRWGAHAKVAVLEQSYPEVFGAIPKLRTDRDQQQAPEPSSSTKDSTLRLEAEVMLDLPAVLRAAQAISGEIVLDRLLDKLMSIVIENAGAQRGVLILPRTGDDSLEIVAERAAGREATRLTASVEDDELASSGLIHYVVRTGESVVLADAAKEGLFTADPYVVRRRSKSILCAPLVNQGHLVAVVYLENDLAVGAFTEGRVEVLRVLSAQAALSVHNALLYARLEEHNRTLEHKVSERTSELVDKNEQLARTLVQLREAQEQLVLREKMASLGALTAGIAHELRNPFNFINNFAELSKELTAELKEELDAYSETRDEERWADISSIVEDLSNNVASIERHGLRANDILSSMLVHTVVKNQERTTTDLNKLVRQSAYLAHAGSQTRYGSPAARLEASYDAGTPSVEASSELGRVFINLVENACYATMQKRRAGAESGYEPEIRVSTTDVGNHVEVRVRDNGTGIAKEHQDKIFNPFFTTKPPGDGTGLGLSLSYNIVVRKHGGSIRVDSQEGQYTEFTVSLPKSSPTKFERKQEP